MRVGVVVQAKVTLVLRLVDRLAQRTQEHGLDHVGVLAIGNLQQQMLVMHGGRFSAAAEIQAQLSEELAQALQFFLAGALVHPLQHG